MSGGKRSTDYNSDMAREQNNSKRWRPRWSVRILLIVITLICAYLACWVPTKTQGVEDVLVHVYGVPLDDINPDYVVRGSVGMEDNNLYYDEYIVGMSCSAEAPLIVGVRDSISSRHYYFWFFGYVATTPDRSTLNQQQHRFKTLPRNG